LAGQWPLVWDEIKREKKIRKTNNTSAGEIEIGMKRCVERSGVMRIGNENKCEKIGIVVVVVVVKV